MKAETKADRRRWLRRILAEGDWRTQQDLARALAERGHDVSQATLSRDLRDMGVVRIAGPDGSRYALPETGTAPEGPGLLAMEVTSVEANEATVLVKTWPGRAQGVALSLEHMNIDGVLGTVAGDDTILVVPESVHRTADLAGRLETLLLSPRKDAMQA